VIVGYSLGGGPLGGLRACVERGEQKGEGRIGKPGLAITLYLLALKRA